MNIEPADVVRMIDQYVEEEYTQAGTYDNKGVLDEDGIYNLHTLAAEIFALGYEAGRASEAIRNQAKRQRERDTKHG